MPYFRPLACSVKARTMPAEHRDAPASHALLAGFVAGTLSRSLTAPLDRIKVLSQEGRIIAFQHALHHPTVHVTADAHRRRVSIGKIMRIIYAEGGILGFWRGNGANCVKAGPELALVFYLRVVFIGILSDFFNIDTWRCGDLFVNFWSSAGAGATAQCLLYPLETAKTRIAVANAGEYSGLYDCLRQGYARGGMRDLYRGLAANLMGIVPYRGLEIGTFFALKDQYEATMQQPIPVHVTAVIATFASGLAQTVTYPINLVRTRLQTQGVNGRPLQYTGIAHCVSVTVANDGIVGLFRGLTANYLKAVPSSVITFITVGMVQDFLAASA